MTKPKLGGFPEPVRQLLEPTVGTKPLDGDELSLRGAARAHEIRVVGVREPVRARARLGDDRALLERQDRLGGAHECEQRLDPLPALHVGERVGRAFGSRELDAFGACEAREERGRLARRRPQLEVWRAPQRERPRTEERAAQVGGAAAAARYDSARRPVERRVPAVDDARGSEHPQRVGVPLDMQLKPRRGVEGPTSIGADLGAEPARAEKRKRPPRCGAAAEVEMERPVAAAAQMKAPGRVEERRELGPPVAFPLWRDCRELLTDVLGRDQSETPSSASSRRLTSTPALP